MNKIVAKIIEIQSVDNLNIVKFDFYGSVLKMISLELDASIKVGKQVCLIVKPMHLTLAKDFSGMLSFCNKIEAKIISYENGKLLSSVKLKAEETVLESIITRESFIEMDLKVDEKVAILIKASEISILEVL